MVVLDSSSLIRFFTKDDNIKANKVKKLLESKEKIFIPEVVYPELEYVLMKDFKQSRKRIIDVFRFLVALPNHKITNNIREAVNIFEKTNLDMADSLIVAYSLKGNLASFDKQMLEFRRVKRYW